MNLCCKEVRCDAFMLTEPIGLIALPDPWEERSEAIIVGTQHSQSIERHLINELEKTLVNAIHTAVVIEMFSIEIRDRDNSRRQTEKRPVALIGFRHKEIA